MSKILVGRQLIAGQTTPINYTKRIVTLTQSQYDELVEQGQVETDQLYWITDGTDADIINDIGTSLDTTYSSQHEQALLDTKANKASTYSKAETDTLINSKLSSALKYKGIVATVADLSNIVDPDNGDSYVVTADGIMYAYNQSTSQWDALGAPMDLTNYYTKDEVDTIIEDLQIKIQYDTMPTASAEITYPIQYTGATNRDYTCGAFYKAVADGSGYKWVEIMGSNITYVSSLPTTNIKNTTYGIKEPVGVMTTVDFIKPTSGTPTKEQAIKYFQQYFTVTEVDDDTISLSVYPDLVLKRDMWSDAWVAGTYFDELQYIVSTSQLRALKNSVFVAETSAWGETSEYYIHCSSANFPVWNYYNGNEEEQSLHKLGSSDVNVDNTTIIKNQDGTISVSPAYKKIFNGTEEEFLALDVEERKQYDFIADTDDLVNGARHYSTTETKTGMYWIDGKPIYRKVLVTTTAFTLGTEWSDFCYYCGSPVLNIDVLTHAEFLVERGIYIIKNNKDSIHIARTASSRSVPVGSTMIIEYTKTTD